MISKCLVCGKETILNNEPCRGISSGICENGQCDVLFKEWFFLDDGRTLEEFKHDKSNSRDSQFPRDSEHYVHPVLAGT